MIPRPGDSEGTLRSLSQVAPAHLSTTYGGSFTLPLFIAERQSSRDAANTNFNSLWFIPTGNRARVCSFSSKRFIHSTTDENPELTC